MVPPFLTSAIDEGELSASRFGRFSSGKEAPLAHVCSWVGHRGMGGKNSPYRKSNPDPFNP
jgi:hypothetical protein